MPHNDNFSQLGAWLATTPQKQYSLGDLKRFEDERARNQSVIGDINAAEADMGRMKFPWTEPVRVQGIIPDESGLYSPKHLRSEENLYHAANMKRLYGE